MNWIEFKPYIISTIMQYYNLISIFRFGLRHIIEGQIVSLALVVDMHNSAGVSYGLYS
jgi:hypothetical protein